MNQQHDPLNEARQITTDVEQAVRNQRYTLDLIEQVGAWNVQRDPHRKRETEPVDTSIWAYMRYMWNGSFFQWFLAYIGAFFWEMIESMGWTLHGWYRDIVEGTARWVQGLTRFQFGLLMFGLVLAAMGLCAVVGASIVEFDLGDMYAR